MHLKWSDVSMKEKTLTVRSAPEWEFWVKDKEERVIPIPERTCLTTQSLSARRNPKAVLGNGYHQATGRTRKLLRTLKRLANQAGLQCGACEGCREQEGVRGVVSCTGLDRRTSRGFIRAGIDLRTIMRLSGHSDLDTILKYLRPADNEETQAAINGIAWQ